MSYFKSKKKSLFGTGKRKLLGPGIRSMAMPGVFIVCVLAGIVAGRVWEGSIGESQAASANITVEDNDQVVSIDQSGTTQTIQRTSRVTVVDSEASSGYTLTARIAQNTVAGASVTIGSASSTTCTMAAPCTLNSVARDILSTTTGEATSGAGQTTTWTVKISVPGNTALSNYIVDIEYGETANPPRIPTDPGNTTLGAMQSLKTANDCPTTHGTAFDARNGQTYWVRKIGNLCWMETNLRYEGYDGSKTQWDPSWDWNDDRYAINTTAAAQTTTGLDNSKPMSLVTSGYAGGSQATAPTLASRHDPGGSTTLDTTTPTNNTTFYGYLYSWCAAMGGQASACQNSTATQPDINISICPAGWRIPTGSGGIPANEFQAMANDASVNAPNNATGSTNLRNNFLAVYSGIYYSDLGLQGSRGQIWSSTVYDATASWLLYVDASRVNPGTNSGYRYQSYAVRCVLG